MLSSRPAVLAAALLLAITAASAEETPSRLERIRSTGVLIAAHGETAVPFSYIDRNGPVGFGVDLTKRIASAIKARLGLRELQLRWNPVTLSTRFPMMTSNAVDIECVTTTHTRAREALVSFSTTFFISDEGIAARRNSGIAGPADLAGKRIAVTQGTTTEHKLRAQPIPGASLLVERNNRRAVDALDQGRADAFVAAVPIIAGQLARLENHAAYTIIGSDGHQEAFACMLPKGDSAFKRVVDETLIAMMTSGEMEKLYNKWFMAPIPPLDRTIGLPLSRANQALYRAPDDAPLE